MRLLIANGEPIRQGVRVTYTFVWPPSTGTKVILPPGSTYYIQQETQGTGVPDPISIVITRSEINVAGGGGTSAETKLFNYSTSTGNQTMILGGDGGGTGGGNIE